MVFKPRAAKTGRPAAVRPGTKSTIYAIGDLHGRLDLFERLLEKIREDAAQISSDEPPTLILLGDLIDRGPDSAGCVERAIALRSEGWCKIEAVMGNHEEALLLFLEDHEVGPNWAQYGGDATLGSYGVSVARDGATKGWAAVRQAFVNVFPDEHRQYVEAMALSLEIDDYLFVHAGVRPGLPITQQTKADLLWIREAFLTAETPYPGKVVVHGHTPTRAPVMRRWRIGIDTGAYASGLLTAVRLRGYERLLIQVSI